MDGVITPANRAWWTERRVIILLSLAVTWLFFIEYLPPLRRFHFIWDIGGFHYPLLNYAYTSLRAGRFPEWDPSIYCGISFAGNIQAGLFYPPNWLLFAANWSRAALTFMSVQILLVLHYWIAFLFTVFWLRDRGLRLVAAVLGGLSFAFSGYLMSEAQHLGATCGTAWIPLALWGIDQAARSRDWRPLWKVVLASAFCFLAGHPFIWVAFCTCLLVYALALPQRRWLAPAGALALGASLLISMVQILPAMEAASMKIRRQSFGGGGLPSIQNYFTLVLPNYFNNGYRVPPGIDESYYYLGAAVLFALVWWLRRGGLRAAAPALIVVGAAHLIMWDPFDLVETLLHRLPPLDQMVREGNFLVSLPLGSALLVGVAMDDFLGRRAKAVRPVLTVLALLAATGWCVRQLVIWARGGDAFLSGWASLAETVIAVTIFGVCLFALRAETRGKWRAALAATLLLLVWTDLKVYGTSRRFDAEPGDFDQMRAGDASLGGPDRLGMERSVYAGLRAATGFRIVENENPTLPEIRHYHLASPQGSDPMLPSRYVQELDGAATFIADRIFRIDPANETLLQRLGVRYVITIRNSPYFRALVDKPRFRLLGSQDSFSAAFEFLDALPAYRWAAGAVTCTRWTAERREFAVTSASGGDFVLIEQFYPGWRAFLDNRPLPIRPFSRAFQQVSVPAGAHRLRFEYRARGLRSGAVISAVSSLLVFLVFRFWRRRPNRDPFPVKPVVV